jgi:rare lipoprotein A
VHRGRSGPGWGTLLVVSSLAIGLAISMSAAQPLEEGTAVSYPEKFVGKRTASGEAYDKNSLTAAHKDHAYGTRLRVTNLANGKSAVVMVNDRLNRSRRDVIEVTPKVARLLGFDKTGQARVRVEVVNAP